MILALLVATGAHWTLLQSVAWTSMLAVNLRTQPLADAVERTFDGRHPCPLCKKIASAKQEQKRPEFFQNLKRLEFAFTPGAFVFCQPARFVELEAVDAFSSSRSEAPLVPPPRG